MVLMDIGLPGLNGIETTAEILRHCPDVKIIILSMYDDEHSVVSAIRSGARAFVLKKASDNDLLDALRAVAKGGSYLSPQVSDRLLQRIQRGDLESKPASSVLDESFAARIAGAAPGGRRQNQQGNRRHAGSGPANRPQLSQDHDEEAGRQQRGRADAARAGRRHHALPGFSGRAEADKPKCMDTPWGALPIADAHVHFFSHRFFRCARRAKEALPLDALESAVGLATARADPDTLADAWVQRTGPARGSNRRRLIASVPGDGESVIGAVRKHPERFYGYMMVNPTVAACRWRRWKRRSSSGQMHALCFFPAMHRYSIQDDRVMRAARYCWRRSPRPGRLRALRRAERGRSQEARAAVAVRHAFLQSHRSARRRAAVIRSFDSSCRISARDISAKR